MPQGWDSYHVALTIEWRDQGHGNQQGRLFSRITGDANWKPITGLSPHELSSTTLHFELSPSELAAKAEAADTLELGYEVCYGGPGHELYVNPNARLAVFRSEPARAKAAKAAEAAAEKTKAVAAAAAAPVEAARVAAGASSWNFTIKQEISSIKSDQGKILWASRV